MKSRAEYSVSLT